MTGLPDDTVMSASQLADPGVELVAASPRLARAPLSAVICVPTFRRPELLTRTLASLRLQDFDRPFAVVVVDNDGRDRAGAAIAADLIASGAMTGAALVQPRQGNCKAYNAAWDFTRRALPQAPFICGIDDDESAEPGWLGALVAAAERSGAGIVGGPVRPVFADPALDHLKLHPVFRSHYHGDGPVPQLYSSANYLIRAGVLDQMGYPYLDEAFDYKGGGDSDFFSRARAAGVRFQWAQAAAMSEVMPARRTEFSWINARSFRNGMISALIEHKARPGVVGRTRTVAKSLALLAASPFRGARDAWRTGSPLIGLYHAQVALGRLGAEFGLNIEQYRNPDKN
jgi:glycosyltransferase involved in cell wall biosynthesis